MKMWGGGGQKKPRKNRLNIITSNENRKRWAIRIRNGHGPFGGIANARFLFSIVIKIIEAESVEHKYGILWTGKRHIDTTTV